MAFFIGIETGTAVCSVAVFEEGRLISLHEEEGRVHSEKTATFLKRCLEEASIRPQDISAVGVSIGPGSYTGLRVGLSVAKGFCYAMEAELLTIDSLAILAAGSIHKVEKRGKVVHCPMIDARRMEVYTALYSNAGEELEPVEAVILDSEFFEDRLQDCDIVSLSGDGAAKVMDMPNLPVRWQDSGVRSSARHMGGLIKRHWEAGEFASVAYAVPKYLKKPNITQSKKTLL